MDSLPRVKSVGVARAPWSLNVTWADGDKDRIDLTGLIHRSRHFRVFLDGPAAFRKVHVADFGGRIEWENGLDYGADTLKILADEQRPVSGADLVAFETELNLGTAETAALLGLAERTVRLTTAAGGGNRHSRHSGKQHHFGRALSAGRSPASRPAEERSHTDSGVICTIKRGSPPAGGDFLAEHVQGSIA